MRRKFVWCNPTCCCNDSNVDFSLENHCTGLWRDTIPLCVDLDHGRRAPWGGKAAEHAAKKIMTSRMAEANLAGGYDVPEEDVLRARFYAILAGLLTALPAAETLESVRSLEGDDTEMRRAPGALASVAAKTSVEEAEAFEMAA